MILICNYLYLTLITCKGQGYIAGEKQRGHTYKLKMVKWEASPTVKIAAIVNI